MTHDPISRPKHYTSHPSGVECLEVTRHMNFNLGNAVKYLWRAGLKGTVVEDLKKARFYIEDEIRRLDAGAIERDRSGEVDRAGPVECVVSVLPDGRSYQVDYVAPNGQVECAAHQNAHALVRAVPDSVTRVLVARHAPGADDAEAVEGVRRALTTFGWTRATICGVDGREYFVFVRRGGAAR